ncbi:MAG: hypothetical protein ACFFG0_04370 [Candidatus Thorarchaeota archaeon]
MANYIKAGHFEASGAAVALPFHRIPDVLIAWNETKFATDATNIVLFWTSAYAAGDASLIVNEADAAIGVAETTNGVTQTNTTTYSESSNQVTATKTCTLSLGSAFYGADSDEIHYIAFFADQFTDHGDINA